LSGVVWIPRFKDHLHRSERARIFALHKIHELANKVPVLALFLLTLTLCPEMRRVCMAELISDLIAIRFVEMSGQGQVAGATQGILLPFRVDRPISVSEAQVDVVLKPCLVRPVVLVRIECLHDVLFASLTVLGDRGQVSQVDQ
jgi:hypothetical protein